MKIIELYQCEICGETHELMESARECEATPLKDDLGVKVGDKVRILTGDGKGDLATVTKIGVHAPSWYSKRYTHSVYLIADVDDGYGFRQLSIGDYEVLK